MTEYSFFNLVDGAVAGQRYFRRIDLFHRLIHGFLMASFLGLAATAQGATLTVCASGCGYSTIGAAITAAKLLGLTATQTRNAVGIAGTMAAGSMMAPSPPSQCCRASRRRLVGARS
mgnify:CR=1 FL=1